LGVGTVEIPTKRSPNRSGVSSHGLLHLKQVLHVPDFICNVIGKPIIRSDDYDVRFDGGPTTMGTIKDSQGKNVAYFDPNRPLFSIKVREQPEGPKLGPRRLQKDGMYMISCQWDATQQQRWLDFQAQNGLNNPGSGSESARFATTNPPYTDAEKAFLKENWRNEYDFLIQYGLQIHKEEDRDEGRSILRAIMQEGDSDENIEDDGLEYVGHQADYNFSSDQLDWIEERYGNSETFMLSYGLRFYDSDHVEEAKAIVDLMMAQDD
jgi:hypothetical protein